MKGERVVQSLNRALHATFAADPRVLLLGEDVLDPYGGAFKVAKGLSTAYPDRVLTTPISEGAIVGIAAGLALCRQRPIVEIMFGDFVALAFDPIVNFASKSVTMYGRKLDLDMVVRCPVGGNRGYGPTHSQSLQKHFIGVPGLDLFELSPFHDNQALLARLTSLGNPCVLFEDKVLYTKEAFEGGVVDDLFSYEILPGENQFARVFSSEFRPAGGVAMICTGGAAHRCVAAARELFVEHEIESQIFVPSRLYPLSIDAIAGHLRDAAFVFTVEEGVAGGSWGTEVADTIYRGLWGQLKNRVRTLTSRPSIIPSSSHLESRVLIQTRDVYEAIAEAVRG